MERIVNTTINIDAKPAGDKKRKSGVGNAISYLLLSIVGFSMLIPLLFMLSTSLKDPGSVLEFPPRWIPNPIRWDNYPAAWNAVPIGIYYINSIFVAVCVTFGQVFTSALSAYAFARLNFPGRDKLFFGYLATMMIPGSVTMIPVFILCKQLNLVDTYWALILPGIFSAMGTFLLRQFFMSLPKELEDAAKIDGCTLFGIFWRIVLPLSKPSLATLATFTFMGSWGSFLWPLVIINDEYKKTLPIGLASFLGMHSSDWTLLMAGTMLALIPVIVVFVFNQRFFVEGLQLGAVKG